VKPKPIATVTLCDVPMQVYVNPENGSGSFDFQERTVVIGIARSWWHTMSVLLHEAFEASAAHLGCRYVRANTFVQHDSYSFHMSHEEYERVCQEAAYFMSGVVPELSTAYKAHHKKRGNSQ
jgi:hypothetical protein